jgi:hypothetical protein
MQDFGRPASLTIDGSRQQCWQKTEFMDEVHQYKTHLLSHNRARQRKSQLCGVSEYLDLGFYKWAWYKETLDWARPNEVDGWVCCTKREAYLMLYWILTKGCQVLSRNDGTDRNKLGIRTDENVAGAMRKAFR